MKREFTPGKWMVKTNNGKDYLLVETNDTDCKTICKCQTMPFEEIPIKEAEANARLMAAAPDMYRALKEVFAWMPATTKTDKRILHGIQAILNRINNNQ